MDNPSEEIKPGMHAEVEFPTEIFAGRLLVPQQAILVRSGRKLVFAVEGDTAGDGPHQGCLAGAVGSEQGE